MRGTRIATASVRTGFAMTPLTRGEVCGPMWASAPTEVQHEVPWAGDRKGRPYGEVARGAGKESSSHGFAVPAPFRQGGRGDGGTDCHDQFANWSRNDTVNKRRGTNPGGRTEASAPTEVQQEVPWAGDRKGRPYGSVQGMRRGGAPPLPAGGVEPRPYEFFAIQIFAIKKGCR